MRLGEHVTCAAVLERRTIYRGSRGDEKRWEPRAIELRDGIFIGWRTLSNGMREWRNDEGYCYTPAEYIGAALVVFSLHENPAYVPIDACVVRL